MLVAFRELSFVARMTFRLSSHQAMNKYREYRLIVETNYTRRVC